MSNSYSSPFLSAHYSASALFCCDFLSTVAPDYSAECLYFVFRTPLALPVLPVLPALIALLAQLVRVENEGFLQPLFGTTLQRGRANNQN